MKIRHIKIKYFGYSNSEVAVWALTNTINECDEDLLYYVNEMFEWWGTEKETKKKENMLLDRPYFQILFVYFVKEYIIQVFMDCQERNYQN